MRLTRLGGRTTIRYVQIADNYLHCYELDGSETENHWADDCNMNKLPEGVSHVSAT